MLVWLKFSTMAVGALCAVVCESGIYQLQTHLSCADSLDSVQLSGQSWWLGELETKRLGIVTANSIVVVKRLKDEMKGRLNGRVWRRPTN